VWCSFVASFRLEQQCLQFVRDECEMNEKPTYGWLPEPCTLLGRTCNDWLLVPERVTNRNACIKRLNSKNLNQVSMKLCAHVVTSLAAVLILQSCERAMELAALP